MVRIKWDNEPLAQWLALGQWSVNDVNCYSCLFLAVSHLPFIPALDCCLNFSHGLHETDPHLTWPVSFPFPPVSTQIISTSNASQTVILVYVVGNRSSFLNGTVASSLLRQLSAELVGFYLTYPPLTIAEREYDHITQGPGHFPWEPCSI